MKLTGISLFATVAAAMSIDMSRRESSPLDVKIEMEGNSKVHASITNTGDAPLKVLKTGSILDNTAIEKSEVYSGADKLAFDGIRLQISTFNVPEESFQVIAPGETVSTSWDVAQVHDLSTGGSFDITTVGALQYADDLNSTVVTGAYTYASNVVSASVDGAAAAKVRRSFTDHIARRTVVQSDCSGSRGTAQRTALSNCRSLAQAASTAASSGAAAKMTEYFKSSTSSTRSTVAAVFSRVASECGSTTSGSSRQYCSDVLGACGSNVLAYTQPSSGIMVSCPLYFSALPALSRTCHAQDQATTTLHEMTHLSQIRGTSDYNCYGYSCTRALSASQNLNHADTYTLFANAIYVGC